MRKFTGIVWSALFFTTASGQNDNTSDMQELRSLNARFINNFVTNDSASHNKILHQEFVCITPDGKYINRQDYLNAWANGFDGYKYWDYRDENIKIIGTTALVRSKNKYVVIRGGKEVTGMSMYTDTYVKQDGQWKCIQAQLTRVSPENYSGDETIVRKYDFRK
jgi:hypothetical protein